MKRYHLCFWENTDGTNKEICPKCGSPILDQELIGGIWKCTCELKHEALLGVQTPVYFTFTGDRSWNGEMVSWSTPEDNGWKPHEKFTGSMLLKNASDEQNILRDESTGEIIAIRNAFTLTGNYESSDSDIDGSFPVTGQATDELKFTNNGFKFKSNNWSIIYFIERQEVTSEQDIIDYANGNTCDMMVTVEASNDWWESILFNGDEDWVDYEKFVSLTAASSHNQTFVEQDGYIENNEVTHWDEGGEDTWHWPFVGPTFVDGVPGPLQMTTIQTVQFRFSPF